MKRESVVCWMDILVIQMNQWVAFTALASLWVFLGEAKPPVLLWALLVCIPVLLFLVRRYIDKLWILAGSHLLCVAIGVVMNALPQEILAAAAGGAGNLTGRVAGILIALYAISCGAYSFGLRIKTKNRLDPVLQPIPAIIIAAGALLLAHYQGQKQWDGYYVGAIVVYLCCYFLQYYMGHYLYFVEVNESSAGHIPEREMFSSGIRLTTVYTAVGAIVLFLVADVGWVSWMFVGFKQILAWLLRLLPIWEAEEPVLEEAAEQIQPQSFEMLGEPVGEPWWVWRLLEAVAVILMVCGILALLVYGIIRLVRFLKERLSVKMAISHKAIMTDSRDVREKCRIEKPGREKRAWGIFLSPTEKIRRIYKQYILSQRERLIGDGEQRGLGSFTARECEKLLEEQLAVEVYEKARYSGEECTKSDVERMKRVVKS